MTVHRSPTPMGCDISSSDTVHSELTHHATLLQDADLQTLCSVESSAFVKLPSLNLIVKRFLLRCSSQQIFVLKPLALLLLRQRPDFGACSPHVACSPYRRECTQQLIYMTDDDGR